jgi:hypothetical protein
VRVQGGPGSFTITAEDVGDVIDAMLAKFMIELAADWRVPGRDRGGLVVALAGML